MKRLHPTAAPSLPSVPPSLRPSEVSRECKKIYIKKYIFSSVTRVTFADTQKINIQIICFFFGSVSASVPERTQMATSDFTFGLGVGDPRECRSGIAFPPFLGGPLVRRARTGQFFGLFLIPTPWVRQPILILSPFVGDPENAGVT